VSSRINRIINQNRPGIRNANRGRPGTFNRPGIGNNGLRANGLPRTAAAHGGFRSSLPKAVVAMRIAHIRQQLQNGTILPAVAAAQIAHLMHGNQTGTGTPGGNAHTPGQHIPSPHFPGQHVPGNNTNHPTHTPGSTNNPGNNGANNRPMHRPAGQVAGGNGQGRPFRGFRFGANNGGGTGAGGTPAAGGGAAGGVPASQAPADPNANCLTRTTLADGSILFRDLCTGELALAPGQPQAQQ